MGSVDGHHYYDGDNDDESHYGGTSLMVQWLRLHTPNAGGLRPIPGRVTRSCMSQQRSHVLQLRQIDKEKETFLRVILRKHVARPLQLCSPS